MKMKKWILVCFLCLCGCSKSFKNGNIELNEVVDTMNEQIIKQELTLPLLKSTNHFNGVTFDSIDVAYMESVIAYENVKIAIVKDQTIKEIQKQVKKPVTIKQIYDYVIIINGKNADKFMKLLKP